MRWLAAVLCLFLLAACSNETKAEAPSRTESSSAAQQPSAPTDSPSESPSESPPASPSEGVTAEDAAPAVEAEDLEPKSSEASDGWSLDSKLAQDVGQVDTSQVQQSLPPEGTTVWGEDGCLWQVTQGYWMKNWMCRVPDANGAANIWFIYPAGTDPQESWIEEITDDPAITGNGTYTVFYVKNTTHWMRCTTACADQNTWEVYDGGRWYTSADWNAQMSADSIRASAGMLGGQQQGINIITQSQGPQIISSQGGDPAKTDVALLLQKMQNDLNNSLIKTWLAPACNSSYNGCA
jgi:hypothetical protein